MGDAKVCGKCNLEITTQIINAMGKSWHPEHFQCVVCEQPISGGTFNNRDGSPVCGACFLEKFTDICFGCKQPITDRVIKALEQTWHQEHFVCGGACKKPLSGASFYEREGTPYCPADYEILFASKCKGCNKPIMDKAVVALDAKWHKDCFKCKTCQKPITSNTFGVEDDQPLCTECLG